MNTELVIAIIVFIVVMVFIFINQVNAYDKKIKRIERYKDNGDMNQNITL